jgi:GR25 family glycosyltransferase involved in LPS biosynthesis
MFNWIDCHAKFVNLAHRADRLAHMKAQLAAAGLVAERHEAIKTADHTWDPVKYGTMLNRTPGAIGCYLSQMEVMKEAASLNKSAFVMEDDLIFCHDIQKRLNYIQDFINTKAKDFDVIWLGGTFHVGPAYWHSGRNGLLPNATIGRDAERTEDPRMLRTYGCFSTHAYIVNVNSIEKILNLLDQHIPTSIGIDYSFIKMQPSLKTYSFVPGCIKQMDNQSDIGNGITVYSGFSRLNGTEENSMYWWQPWMHDFDPKTFDWKEAK